MKSRHSLATTSSKIFCQQAIKHMLSVIA